MVCKIYEINCGLTVHDISIDKLNVPASQSTGATVLSRQLLPAGQDLQLVWASSSYNKHTFFGHNLMQCYRKILSLSFPPQILPDKIRPYKQLVRSQSWDIWTLQGSLRSEFHCCIAHTETNSKTHQVLCLSPTVKLIKLRQKKWKTHRTRNGTTVWANLSRWTSLACSWAWICKLPKKTILHIK